MTMISKISQHISSNVNRFDWSRTLDDIHRSEVNDVNLLSMTRIPAIKACRSRVLFRVSRSNSRMMCWCRREKICQGKAMMHPFTWRETNKMIWRTDIGLTQRWSIGQRVKIATLSWSGYRTHKGRPIDDGGMIVTLVELLLNKRHDTLAALTRLKNYRPKFEKGMTSKESTDLPNTRHKCEGRCRVQEWLLPRLHSIFLFQIPQPYGWVLLSCFTSSREITDARYKPILRMSPPKYF